MDDRALLRHCLAILAYRGGKFIQDAPPAFVAYDTGGGKTPLHILSHIADLLEWGLRLANGKGGGRDSKPTDWPGETKRFYQALEAFDRFLVTEEPIVAEVPRLLQGPLADALTHVGQIAILRRMAGSPVYGENYFVADITAGRIGPDQPPPRKPFR